MLMDEVHELRVGLILLGLQVKQNISDWVDTKKYSFVRIAINITAWRLYLFKICLVDCQNLLAAFSSNKI